MRDARRRPVGWIEGRAAVLPVGFVVQHQPVVVEEGQAEQVDRRDRRTFLARTVAGTGSARIGGIEGVCRILRLFRFVLLGEFLLVHPLPVFPHGVLVGIVGGERFPRAVLRHHVWIFLIEAIVGGGCRIRVEGLSD